MIFYFDADFSADADACAMMSPFYCRLFFI